LRVQMRDCVRHLRHAYPAALRKVVVHLYNSLYERPQPISAKQVPSVKQGRRHADTIPRLHEDCRDVLHRGPVCCRDGPATSYERYLSS